MSSRTSIYPQRSPTTILPSQQLAGQPKVYEEEAYGEPRSGYLPPRMGHTREGYQAYRARQDQIQRQKEAERQRTEAVRIHAVESRGTGRESFEAFRGLRWETIAVPVQRQRVSPMRINKDVVAYGASPDESVQSLVYTQRVMAYNLERDFPKPAVSSLTEQVLSGALSLRGIVSGGSLPSYVYVPPRMGGKDLVAGAVGSWEAPVYSVSRLAGVSAPESPKTFTGALLSPFKEPENIGLRMAGVKEWTGPEAFASRSPEYWIGSALGELALSTALSIGISKAHQVASEKIVQPVARRLATTSLPFGQPSVLEKYVESPTSLNWAERQILQKSRIFIPKGEVSVPMAEKLTEYGGVKGGAIQPELTIEAMGFTEYKGVGGVWIGEPYPEKIVPMKMPEYFGLGTQLIPKTDIYKEEALGFEKPKLEREAEQLKMVTEGTSFGPDLGFGKEPLREVKTKGVLAYRGWPTVRELQEQQKLLPLVTQTVLTRQGIYPDVPSSAEFTSRTGLSIGLFPFGLLSATRTSRSLSSYAALIPREVQRSSLAPQQPSRVLVSFKPSLDAYAIQKSTVESASVVGLSQESRVGLASMSRQVASTSQLERQVQRQVSLSGFRGDYSSMFGSVKHERRKRRGRGDLWVGRYKVQYPIPTPLGDLRKRFKL